MIRVVLADDQALVRAGFRDGDALAALFVAVIIFAAAWRLVLENAQVLMDTAPAAAQEVARDAIVALGPEIELERLRLRESAGRYFADVVVAVAPGRAVVEGHAAADHVDVVLGVEQCAEAGADERLIVGEHHADH